MAKYLLQGSYTVEGLRGVLREGGTKRREAVAQLVQALGGALELMRQAEQALSAVKIYHFTSTDDIMKLVEHHREKLFSFARSTPAVS